MNLAAAAKLALRRAPCSMRGTIVFTDQSKSATSTGEGYAVAAHLTQSDDFKAGTTVVNKARVMTVLPDGLSFAPAAGQLCDWADVRYSVLAAKAYPEIGDVAFYRVWISR